MPESQSSSHDCAIQAVGLRKSFGHIEALKGVDLSLKPGEFLTVFGPNGAGKTTLIRILSSLTRPTDGVAHVAGFDVAQNDPDMRRRIGVISHHSFLYGDLTALENIKFYARMYGLEDPEGRAAQVIDEVGLKLRMQDRVSTFSRGMLQRLSIARAIVHDPSVLFLDEPYTGLDQHASLKLREQLETLHTKKRTVLMTTHDFARGLEMCDRVAIQVKGRFAFMEAADRIDKKDFENLYLHHVGAGA